RTDVNVHEVHTDGRVAHARLAGAWLANRDGFQHQDFRPAGLMETDSVGHVVAPLGYERSSMIGCSQNLEDLSRAAKSYARQESPPPFVFRGLAFFWRTCGTAIRIRSAVAGASSRGNTRYSPAAATASVIAAKAESASISGGSPTAFER